MIGFLLNIPYEFKQMLIEMFEYEVVELEELNIERIIKLVGVYNMHTRKLEWLPKEYIEKQWRGK